MRTGRALGIVAAFLLGATVLGACVGHAGRGAARGDPGTASEPRPHPTVSQAEVDRLFFDIYWDSSLGNETILSLQFQDDTLYATTESNSIYAIDFRSGEVRWVFQLPRPVAYVLGSYNYRDDLTPGERQSLERYDEVFAVAEDVLYVIDKQNGSLLWRRSLPFTAASGATASLTHVFVGSWDGRVYAISKATRQVDWFWYTGAHVTSAAVQKSPNVYVPSESGIVFAFKAFSGDVVWEFHTDRRIAAASLLYKNRLYIGSADYNVYAVNLLDGHLEWRFPTGAPVLTTPVGIGNTIFAASDDNALYALHRSRGREGDRSFEAGEAMWSYPRGDQVLARGLENVYILAHTETGESKIVAIDEDEGYARWDDTGLASQVDFFVTNSYDPFDDIPENRERAGLVFLGFEEGYIVALREKTRY